MNEIKTLEERENTLIAKGKEKGFITYEQLAEELKGLEIDSDALDNLYNKLVENKIEVVAEADVDSSTGEARLKPKEETEEKPQSSSKVLSQEEIEKLLNSNLTQDDSQSTASE